MTGSKFVEAEGFARYWQDKESKGILVPEAVLKAVQADAKANAQDMTAQAATKESAPQPKHGGPPLPKIRVHTDWDISDALAYAQKLLQGVAAPVLVPAKFSNRPLKKCSSNAPGSWISRKRVVQTRLRSECEGHFGLFAGRFARFGRTYPMAHA